MVALVFAYYFTQKNIDNRKIKEIIEDIIIKIQIEISNDSSYIFEKDFDKKVIMLKLRNLNNKIDILESAKKELKISEEVNYIHKEFDEYRESIGENLEDINFLITNQKEFMKKLQNIDNKCDELKMRLYK
ncbi:hypothetical protein SDC9_143619 [bioreactor metagenome]|uniref:Chromosome partition protein Smc n=1 Tax=bioreactor metagenome TaxID=1076179 RepID=A0A645E4F5_9ZZZZ